MLHAVVNKSWKQHLIKQQLHGYLRHIKKAVQAMLGTAGEAMTVSYEHPLPLVTQQNFTLISSVWTKSEMTNRNGWWVSSKEIHAVDMP